MEGIIGVTAVVLIVIYIGLAIWVICKRRTVAGSIGASAGFLCGGLVMIPAASSIADLYMLDCCYSNRINNNRRSLWRMMDKSEGRLNNERVCVRNSSSV